MAERKFSELPSAASLTGNELAALSQMQSGSLASVKSTLQAIANWFAVYAQYTTALQTTDKSIAGAINELKQLISLIPQFSIEVVQVLPTEDISDTTIYLVPAEDPEVGNYYEEYIYVINTWELVGTTAVDLSAYYTKLEVDGLLADKLEADDFEANQTASANPITLETKQAGLAKSCVVEMNPIQDLHGYDNPWVGGAGKNKLPFDISAIKALNTAGTWSGDAYTHNGVTYSLGSDGIISTSGTASGTSVLRLPFTYSEIEMILNGCPSGGGVTVGYSVIAANSTGSSLGTDTGSGVTISASNVTNITQIQVIVRNGTSADNLQFKPMMRLSTVTDATFAPYENICPISGRTEVNVTRTGINQWNGVWEGGDLNVGVDGANHTNANRIRSKDFVRVKPNTTYYFKTQSYNNFVVAFYAKDKSYPYNAPNVGYKGVSNNTLTIPEWCYYIRFYFNATSATYNNDVSVNYPATDTEYHAYQGETYTHQYSETIYGGVDDFVNGGLDNEYELFEPTTVTTVAQSSGLWYWAFSLPKTSTNPLSTNGLMSSHFNPTNQVLAIGNCSITANGTLLLCVPADQTLNTGALVNAWLAENDLQFAYKPATPDTTIQLFPEAVTLLKGLNVISTDGDKVQVEFSDIPVGDYSVLLDYIKSLEARIAAVEP